MLRDQFSKDLKLRSMDILQVDDEDDDNDDDISISQAMASGTKIDNDLNGEDYDFGSDSSENS